MNSAISDIEGGPLEEGHGTETKGWVRLLAMGGLVAVLGTVLVVSSSSATSSRPIVSPLGVVSDASSQHAVRDNVQVQQQGVPAHGPLSGALPQSFQHPPVAVDGTPDVPQSADQTTTSAAGAQLRLKVQNSYTSSSPITWSPWPYLAEPYRLTNLEATCSGDDCQSGIDQYRWVIDGQLLQGSSIGYNFTSTGITPVLLTRMDSESSQVLTQASFNVMVKYVRREIRALSDEDRERLLNAMQTVYRWPTALGQATYGPGYKGIEYFVSKHLDGAGRQECDGWHDDAGIMTHHVGFTLEFEQNLQLIDPLVSMPYWEYTLDAYLYSSLDDSPIFQEDWFGVMSPPNDLHTVTEGRWAHTTVMTDAWDSLHNPYGLLRSPWNTDPTPFITRHDKVAGKTGYFTPGCSTFAKCFKQSSIAELNNCLNGATHGPVHILIGGEWGHPDESFLQSWGIFGKLVLIFKALWRQGYARVPEDCTGTAAEDCKVACPAEIYQAHNMTAYDVLVETQAMTWVAPTTKGNIYLDAAAGKYRIAGLEDDDVGTQDLWQRILDSLCNPGYAGEMFTSAAPYDPTFWLIHPTAERFLGQRRLVAEQGQDSRALDETWGYAHKGDTGDDGLICDWTDVEGTALPKCEKGTCPGHRATDLLPFMFSVNGQPLEQFTNTQLYDWIHPHVEELPYMYDSYEWQHCEEQGYSLS